MKGQARQQKLGTSSHRTGLDPLGLFSAFVRGSQVNGSRRGKPKHPNGEGQPSPHLPRAGQILLENVAHALAPREQP